MNGNTFQNLNNNTTTVACIAGTISLENLFATVCEALERGTRECYEKAMEAFRRMTPYRLKECVDDFIDCYNIHASGCKHQLHVMRSDMKKRILTAMSKMKRYIEHGMQLVFRSDAYAGLLRETYYVWDWIDLSDVRGIIRLLKDSEMMESQIEATDGRRFIHELNELLRKSLGKVEDSARSDLNDATTTGVWVLNFCDDIKGIISEKSAQWDDYISKYMERRGCDEYEACDELRTMAENSMVESDFYLKDSEKDLARLVRHIRSMQGNEEGENLDAFKLYFAQWEYLSKKMSKIGALAGFHQAIYRDCRSGAMVDIPEEDEKPVEAIECNGIPTEINTPKARFMFRICRKNGWVDAHCKPVISQKRAAILASVMSDALDLSPRWAAFEKLWNIGNLANKLSQAQNCNYYVQTLKEMEAAINQSFT